MFKFEYYKDTDEFKLYDAITQKNDQLVKKMLLNNNVNLGHQFYVDGENSKGIKTRVPKDIVDLMIKNGQKELLKFTLTHLKSPQRQEQVSSEVKNSFHYQKLFNEFDVPKSITTLTKENMEALELINAGVRLSSLATGKEVTKEDILARDSSSPHKQTLTEKIITEILEQREKFFIQKISDYLTKQDASEGKLEVQADISSPDLGENKIEKEEKYFIPKSKPYVEKISNKVKTKSLSDLPEDEQKKVLQVFNDIEEMKMIDQPDEFNRVFEQVKQTLLQNPQYLNYYEKDGCGNNLLLASISLYTDQTVIDNINQTRTTHFEKEIKELINIIIDKMVENNFSLDFRSAGSDVMIQNTAMTFAIKQGLFKIAIKLAENGADANKPTGDGVSALQIACFLYGLNEDKEDTKNLIFKLVENGGDLTIEHLGYNSFHYLYGTTFQQFLDNSQKKLDLFSVDFENNPRFEKGKLYKIEEHKDDFEKLWAMPASKEGNFLVHKYSSTVLSYEAISNALCRSGIIYKDMSVKIYFSKSSEGIELLHKFDTLVENFEVALQGQDYN